MRGRDFLLGQRLEPAAPALSSLSFFFVGGRRRRLFVLPSPSSPIIVALCQLQKLFSPLTADAHWHARVQGRLRVRDPGRRLARRSHFCSSRVFVGDDDLPTERSKKNEGESLPLLQALLFPGQLGEKKKKKPFIFFFFQAAARRSWIDLNYAASSAFFFLRSNYAAPSFKLVSLRLSRVSD